MPVIDMFQTTFEGGEISDRLISRVDLPRYKKSLLEQTNSYSYFYGGATKRRGTLFVGELYNSNEPARLIPYEHEGGQIIIVLNGGKAQFIKDEKFIETSPGVRYTVNQPYSAAQLQEVRYTQAGAAMFMTHQAHAPQLVTRNLDTAWTFAPAQFVYNAVSDVTFANAFIQFKIINSDKRFLVDQQFTITINPDGSYNTTGPTWVGTGTAPTDLGNGQIAGIINQPGPITAQTWTIRCTFTSPSRQEWSVVGSVSGSPSVYWKTSNYPRACAFYDSRLYFGGSLLFPQWIWGSSLTDALNFTVGNREDDAVAVKIGNNKYNSIRHLVGSRQLLVMTNSTEFTYAGYNNGNISGLSTNVLKDHTQNGSNHVAPLRVGQEALFIQGDGRKMRAISYNVTEDANVAPDITVFAEHVSRDAQFVDMAHQQSPDNIVWVVRSDGRLLSLTHSRDFEVTAWAQHTTDGLFENVACMPGEGQKDVFMVVKRTIDGVTKRYVEMFDYTDYDIAYSDCGVYYNGAPTTTLTGLSHLKGKTVVAIHDGLVHPPMVVSSTGTVTLDRPASKILVGLPFKTTLKMLHPEFGDALQSSQGKDVKPSDIIVRFQDTVAAVVNGTTITFRTNTLGLDSTVDPFTGDKTIKEYTWRKPYNVLIESETPAALTVLGVIIRATVN